MSFNEEEHTTIEEYLDDQDKIDEVLDKLASNDIEADESDS